MKAIYFFLFVLLTYSCAAQQKIIDSLKIELVNNNVEDTLRVKLLNDLAYYYHQVAPNEGLSIATKAISLAKKLNSHTLLATAYKNNGTNYKAKGLDSLALLAYDNAISIYKEINDVNGIARTTYNIGIIYFNKSDFRRANECNLKAYAAFEKEKDSFLMAKMLNSIGVNNMYLSDYPKALTNYIDASVIYLKLNKTHCSDYVNIISNIGLLYHKLEKLESSLTYQKRALELYKNIGNQEDIANCLNTLGNVYDDLDEPEKAIIHYKQSYDIMEKIDHRLGMANALTNTGIAYASLFKYKKALHYLKATKKIYEAQENINNLSKVHKHLGVCYMNGAVKNLSKKQKLFVAKNHFEKAFSYAKQIGNLRRQSISLENLALINTKIGDYKEAYIAKTMGVTIKDSIISTEKREEIARLESKYEYAQEKIILKAAYEKKQALNKAEIKRQKAINNGSIIGGGSFFLSVIVGLLLYKRKRDVLLQVKEVEFKAKVADTELKALRVQMNPHFIFNCLNSINSYIQKNDSKAATDYLTKFAKLMRKTLENSEKREVLLADDLELLETYIHIEAKRFNKCFTYEINVDKQIDINNTLIPPLILQPFLENSILHGISEKEEKWHIIIEFKKAGDMIICAVDDNGIGRAKNSNDTNKINGKHSLGMQITKSRIDIINQLKKAKGNLKVIDKDRGVRVEVSLPLALVF